MKRLVEEVNGDGLESLIGQKVVLFGMIYIYSGKLIGVSETDVILEDAGIVYETGPLTEAGFKDFQQFGAKEWMVRTAAIESYGLANND